MQKYYLYLFH